MSRSDFELKTNDQILKMRRAGLITEAALKAVRAAVAPGVSTLELDRIANETIESLGGKSNFQLVPGYHHTICASINEEVVHGIPSADRILQPGDLVSIDAGAIIDGWNGDSAITVLVPGGDPAVAARRERVSRVTEASLWHGIAALATQTIQMVFSLWRVTDPPYPRIFQLAQSLLLWTNLATSISRQMKYCCALITKASMRGFEIQRRAPSLDPPPRVHP
jgi:hypothetical protein